MEGQAVYPTAPAGMQQPHGGINIAPPAPHPFVDAAGGEHVESPGKAKSPLNKVKDQARKLKDKFKKVTGHNTHVDHEENNIDHGDRAGVDHEENKIDHGDRAYPQHPNEYEHDDVDGAGADLHEDNDKEADHIPLGDDQSYKGEQVQLLGAMDKSGDGSEVEIHGGIPASVLSATPGTYNDNALTGLHKSGGPQDSAPISPPANDDQMLEGPRDVTREQAKPSQLEDMPYTSHDNTIKKGPEDSSVGGGSLGLPTFTDVKRSDHPSHPSTSDMFSQREPASTESPTASGVNVAYPDDIVKPNPEFGRSLSPTHNKIAVINEDVPAEMTGLAPAEDFGSQQSLLDKSVPENAPMTFDADDESVDRPGFDHSVRVEDGSRGSRGASILGEKPLVTASDCRKNDKNEGYPDALNDDATEQSPFGRNVLGNDVHRPSPADGLNNSKDAVANTLMGSEKRNANEEPFVDTTSYWKDESGKPAIEDDETREDNEMKSYLDEERSKSREDNEMKSYLDEERSKAPDGDIVVGDVGNVETPKDQENAMVGCETHEDYGEHSSDADARPKSLYNSDGIGSNVDNTAIPIVGVEEGKRLHDHEDINNNLDCNAPTSSNEDVEYYDPNNANHNQFQEGFSLGAGEDEEGKSNGTLAGSPGSAVGKLQGLKENEAPEQQSIPSKDEQANVAPSQQQAGGAFTGLKNMVASKLGYGVSAEEQLPPNDQTTKYEECEEHANAVKAGHTSSSTEEAERSIPSQQQGLKDVVPLEKQAADKKTTEAPERDVSHDKVPPVSPSSYTQKLYDTAAAAKQYLSGGA